MAGTRLAGGGRLWMVEVKREGGMDGGESREFDDVYWQLTGGNGERTSQVSTGCQTQGIDCEVRNFRLRNLSDRQASQ